MSESTNHPIQPLETVDGTLRFKPNPIVRYLLEKGPFDLNDIASICFSDNDQQQFAQLIGYSLNGYSELSYVSDENYAAAEVMSKGRDEKDARIAVLEQMLEESRAAAKDLAVVLFKIHPDDLES